MATVGVEPVEDAVEPLDVLPALAAALSVREGVGDRARNWPSVYRPILPVRYSGSEAIGMISGTAIAQP
ncbi:Uncharacterised protein [Mycobacterium tuberculosis]|nr:Uncharacterised protein [Mycobacterium tuberculosis]